MDQLGTNVAAAAAMMSFGPILWTAWLDRLAPVWTAWLLRAEDGQPMGPPDHCLLHQAHIAAVSRRQLNLQQVGHADWLMVPAHC